MQWSYYFALATLDNHSNGLPCQVPRIFGWFFGHFLSVQFVDKWKKNRSLQKNDSKLITPNSRFVWFSMLCYITIAIKYRKFKRIFSDIKKLFVNANIFNFRIKKLVRVTFVWIKNKLSGTKEIQTDLDKQFRRLHTHAV